MIIVPVVKIHIYLHIEIKHPLIKKKNFLYMLYITICIF